MSQISNSQWAKIKREAQERRERGGGGDCSTPPIVYQPREGRVYLRFYADSSGNVMRDLSEHRDKYGGYACPGQGCQTCAACDELSGWGDIGLYKPQRRTLTYAVILDWSGLGEKDEKYLKKDVPVLFVGKGMLAKLLSDHLAEMGDNEEIEDFFSPEVTGVSYVMQLIIHRRHPWLQMKTRPVATKCVPPLPYDFPPLSECLYPENYQPDKVKVSEFIGRMRAAYNLAMNIKDPPEKSISSALQFLDDDHGCAKTSCDRTIKDTSPSTTRTAEPASQSVTSDLSDDLDDFYDGEPHENCPTQFGLIRDGHQACRLCDLWEQCQRMSVVTSK